MKTDKSLFAQRISNGDYMSGAGSKNIELLLQHIPDFNNVVFFIEFDAAGNPVFVEEVGFVPNLVKN